MGDERPEVRLRAEPGAYSITPGVAEFGITGAP